MEYISTRNSKKVFEFKDVFIKGLADDGGLFIPKSLNKFSKSDIDEFKDLNYQEYTKNILKRLKAFITHVSNKKRVYFLLFCNVIK